MAQVAIMAGAMGGCEPAVASALRDLGYAVVAIVEDVASDAASPLSSGTFEKVYHAASPEEAERVVADVAQEVGEPLVLVHCFLGAGDGGGLSASPKGALDRLFAIGKGTWPRMQAAGFGRIVHIVPTSALTGSGGIAASAGGAAIRGATKVLALEGGRSGISVNTIVTSCIGEDRDVIAPVGRTGSPHDLARGVAFLCDRHSGFATGATLSINGGLHMY